MRSNRRSANRLAGTLAVDHPICSGLHHHDDANDQVMAELTRLLSARTAIVGVGNAEHGDDAFGPALARRLRRLGLTAALDAGTCPENYLGAVVALQPQLVLILDAAEIDRPPGTLMLCDPRDLAAAGLSCHAGSLALLARYLRGMTDADCRLLLVQPKQSVALPDNLDRDGRARVPFSSLSPPVRAAALSVCRTILTALKNKQAAPAAIPHVS